MLLTVSFPQVSSARCVFVHSVCLSVCPPVLAACCCVQPACGCVGWQGGGGGGLGKNNPNLVSGGPRATREHFQEMALAALLLGCEGGFPLTSPVSPSVAPFLPAGM